MVSVGHGRYKSPDGHTLLGHTLLTEVDITLGPTPIRGFGQTIVLAVGMVTLPIPL